MQLNKKLMRKTLVLLLAFLKFMSIYGEVTGDSIYKKRTKELSVNAALVIPVYCNFKFTDSYITSDTKPDINLSYAFGLQYKTKHNILFDFQFQHYQFNYTTPIYGINDGAHYGSKTNYYYKIFNYGQYRNSLGIGGHIKINNKNTLGIVIGFALFTPDHKKISTSTYTDSGILINNSITKNFGGNLSFYYNIRYSYFLNKRLSLIADLNHSYVSYHGTSWPTFGFLYLRSQNIFSLNVGVKFLLINKLTN